MAGLRGVASPPALARLLLLVTLVGGVITMHAVTYTLGSDHDGQSPAAAAVQHHTVGGHADPAAAPCDSDDCRQQHTGLHGCVFVMTAIAIVAGLTLLSWIGIGHRLTPFVSKTGRQCRRRQRAPPWTVLSLYELSILRV